MEHPRLLPIIVDAIGWNIQMRDCIFVVTEPQPAEPCRGPAPRDRGQARERGTLAVPWHFDQLGLFSGLTVDGTMPLVDLKASWYLSDHVEAAHSLLGVVRDSAKMSA